MIYVYAEREGCTDRLVAVVDTLDQVVRVVDALDDNDLWLESFEAVAYCEENEKVYHYTGTLDCVGTFNSTEYVSKARDVVNLAPETYY